MAGANCVLDRWLYGWENCCVKFERMKERVVKRCLKGGVIFPLLRSIVVHDLVRSETLLGGGRVYAHGYAGDKIISAYWEWNASQERLTTWSRGRSRGACSWPEEWCGLKGMPLERMGSICPDYFGRGLPALLRCGIWE